MNLNSWYFCQVHYIFLRGKTERTAPASFLAQTPCWMNSVNNIPSLLDLEGKYSYPVHYDQMWKCKCWFYCKLINLFL